MGLMMKDREDEIVVTLNSIKGYLHRIETTLDELNGSRCLDVRADLAAYIRRLCLFASVCGCELAYMTREQLKEELESRENDNPSSNL